MSNQGLQAHYLASQQSLLRRTGLIMRSLKKGNTSVNEGATLPSAPLSEIPPGGCF